MRPRPAGMRTLLDTPTPLMANSTAQPGHGLGPDGVAAGPTAPTPPEREQVLYRHTLGREDRAFREALRRLWWRMPDKRPKRR